MQAIPNYGAQCYRAVAVKKSTISGNNGALEHPYSRRWAFRDPSFGNLEARAAKDKSVAADLSGDVKSARLCPGAACYCAAGFQSSHIWLRSRQGCSLLSAAPASGFPGSIVNDYGDGSSCHGSRVSEMRYRFGSCPSKASVPEIAELNGQRSCCRRASHSSDQPSLGLHIGAPTCAPAYHHQGDKGVFR